ncbi:hypothetical protein TeGR_g2279 [Tetraparma gracilis]|uniref:Sugar transporter SWEET1 n=1 Tax=Tetraparma gracilis TaxID=2962635 RepID=A0ABQ6N656_9STRA|nr:hypothetical protein TeGR_g2279 [Tetraparma gracilis]
MDPITLVGSFGNLAAFSLFLSPVPTMRTIIRARDVKDFSILPQLVQLVESTLWSCWSVRVGYKEVQVCNLTAVLAMSVYISIFSFVRFFFGAKSNSANSSKNLLLVQLAITALLVSATLAFFFLAASSTTSTTVFVSLATAICVVKYASPLSVIKLVVRTKSTEFMPLPLTLACLACGVLWGAYGLLVEDLWVILPNAAGALLSSFQLLVWLKYSRMA